MKRRQRLLRRGKVKSPRSRSDLATKLRAALPKLWRYTAQKSDGKDRTPLTIAQVRQCLRRQVPGLAEWARGSSDASLCRALRLVATRPGLKMRMGVRFQDNSEHGSWSVENVKGYRERRLGRLPLSRASEVFWHSYWTCFRLQVRGRSEVSVERTLLTKELRARVEKRRRGGGPLHHSTQMIHITAHSRREQAADGRKRIKVVRRAADLLPAVIMQPPQTSNLQRWTLIYLHGMGSTALGSYADRPQYFHDGTAAVKVIIPTAPLREVSCFDTWWNKVKAKEEGKGHRWQLEKFNSWYDYTSNYHGRKEDTLDLDSLHAMQRMLHEIINREAAALGGRTDRIILGGKSQGCATALDAALTFPKRLGGFIGLVGHLLSCTPVEADGPQQCTPFHFYHEVEDDIMQWHWVQKEEQRLRDAGYKIRSMRCKDPEGHGHFIGGIEGQWLRRSLRLMCSRPGN